MWRVIVSYMQFRGRGRNRRVAAYTFFGIMIVGLLYFYPRKKYLREDVDYQGDDLQKRAELFVKDHVEEKEFFDTDDYDDDWKHDKEDDDWKHDKDDDDYDDDDDENTADDTAHEDEVNKNEEILEENEKNKWVKGDEFSRKKNDKYKQDDLLEIPDVEAGEEEHDDELEIPDALDHIQDRNDVELPDNMMEDKDGDRLIPPDVKDNENAEHHADDVELPQDDDEVHKAAESLDGPVQDENLDAPEVREILPKQDNLEAPDEDNNHAIEDNLSPPDPKDRERENDDVIAPDAVDYIIDKDNEQGNKEQNVNVPILENSNDKGDNIDNPVENNLQINDNVKIPDAAQQDLHRDDLQAPDGDDAEPGIAADGVQPVVDGHVMENKNSDAKNTDSFKAKNIHGRSLGACNGERTNIVYIKNIKCASETMVSMLRRFGYTRELNFVQPVDKRIYVGWPYQIDPGYYRANKGKEFNILCEHSIYNKTILSKLMPQSTVYITSIRDPYSQVKSMFKYYNLARALNLEHLKDPFTEYIQNIDKYDKIFKHPNKKNFRQCIPDNFSMTSDLMSFNLGFPTAENGITSDKTRDDVTIDQWLGDLDNSFSLVMMVEYFDESLILLKRMMCWSWKDIMYYSSNVLTYFWKEDKNPENIRIYKERSRVDYKLYDHFNQTFWQRVQNEKNDFWGEVGAYKKIWHEVHEYCENTPNNMIYNLMESQWSKPFSINKNDCTDFVHYYDIFMRIKERYDLNKVKVKQPKMKINVC